jgi:hypothetical protein
LPARAFRAKKPAMPEPGQSHLADLWHRYRYWILAVTIVLLAAGARWERTQSLEAKLVGLAIPLLCVTMGIGRLSEASVGLRRGAGVIALFSLVIAEAELGHVFFPAEPLATASVTSKEPDATIVVPDGQNQFEIESHGTLGAGRAAAEESFVIELERDGQKAELEGTFQRSPSVRVSRRRAPTNTSPHLVDVTLNSVELAGRGPLHAHLASLTGAGGKTIELRIRRPLPFAEFLSLALKALIAGALLVQILAAREGVRARFLAWVAFALVLALYLPRHFSPDDPLGALVGSLFVALLAGGVGGLALGALAGGWVTGRGEV